MIGRREFLLSGALSFAGLARRNTGRNCILFKLTGGPSHIDTWDPKPDAPSGIRGPFKAIETNVPGIQIAETLPRMARCAHRYALIRSVHHDSARFHEEASGLMFGWVTDPSRITIHNSDDAWDCHGWGPFSSLTSCRDTAARFDMAFTSLLENNRLDNTLVVAMGEFGRSPRINPSGGRDHWPHCFTIVMAGAGIRGGQVIGSSDKYGEFPRDNPVTPGMLTATIHKALGLPHNKAAVISPLFT